MCIVTLHWFPSRSRPPGIPVALSLGVSLGHFCPFGLWRHLHRWSQRGPMIQSVPGVLRLLEILGVLGSPANRSQLLVHVVLDVPRTRNSELEALVKTRLLYTCISSLLLPPATKLGQGNIFIGVCDSVHRWWGVPG